MPSPCLHLILERRGGKEKRLGFQSNLYATTHYPETHQRTPDGRYVVVLPKRAPVHLGKSRNIAVRFLQNERSLNAKGH